MKINQLIKKREDDMGSPINSVHSPAAASVSQTAPSSANALTAGAVASTSSNADLTGASKISSLADLKNKAPKVYYQMMVSIATTMITDLQHHQSHLEEIWRQARQDSGET